MKLLRYLLVGSTTLWLLACKNEKPDTLFEEISSSHSNINFENTIVENDSVNTLTVVNIYNGGGVGVADFNNDGLQDLYLTANTVSNKLYLNKGDFVFDDITDKAGVSGMGRWARGVATVDINNDGLMDIYVCNTILKDSLDRANILYINQGNDKDGVPHFKDMAGEYGLRVHVQSTMASFFDYDNDRDLDMFLTVNEGSTGEEGSVFQRRNRKNAAPSLSRLFRNDWDPAAGHPKFTDVSDIAGMKYEGYGHASTICDINNDGWKDIFVANDFISNDILYINNHDGTFTDRLKEYFKHTSFNSMGQDIIDINNDALPDVITLDMNPEDNFRKKMMLNPNNYNTYQSFDMYGYQYQYVRNTLQLNQGPRIYENDSIGAPTFSEIAFMSGVAETDWSWTPLITDFDNDSYRDLIITNGFPRDVTDHDFIAFRKDAITVTATQKILEQIPQVKLHNYAYRNKGDLTFTDETKSWGLSVPTFSSGAAWADFDNDGAMDMVVNNINDKTLVYRNTSRDKDRENTHFLEIVFKGDKQNIHGLGAFATIYYAGKMQAYENNPYRGYLSTNQNAAHFGLGNTAMIDSVVIKWYNGKKQTINNVKADQVLSVSIDNASDPVPAEKIIDANTLFKEITTAAGINYQHKSHDFIDFNIQMLLPHKLSEYSPALASADIDGNGLDDLVAGGDAYWHAQLFFQQPNGKFIQKDLQPGVSDLGADYHDEGLLLFDANGDNHPDLYVVSGGYKYAPGHKAYNDRLFINDGKGNFKQDTLAFAPNFTSKLCVRAMDINKDGKLDLFISGRVDPYNYPKPVTSIILRNDSEGGKVKFTDVTKEVAPDLVNIGLVCDVLFTDFDDDGQTDLLLAGEWMPVTFLKNTGGKFKNVTTSTGTDSARGWWNSIVAGDFRHTGRTDYIIGNTGLNTLYSASDKYPVYITAKKFENTDIFIAIPSLYLPDKEGAMKEFPAFGRDDLIRQMISIRRKYPDYRSFANATMNDILSPEQRKDALRLSVNMSQSCFLRNDGNGKFTIIPLPAEAQVSAINGMIADDFDGDGNLDVMMNGNDYGTEVSVGRFDALNGLLLKGDGKGGFKALSILQSGIYIPGNGKALVKMMSNTGNYIAAASQHKGPLKLFELRKKVNGIKISPDDISAVIKLKDGSIRKEEFYYGTSFLSQSSRFIAVDSTISSVEIKDASGNKRELKF